MSPGEAIVVFGAKERAGPTVMSWFAGLERMVKGRERRKSMVGVA